MSDVLNKEGKVEKFYIFLRTRLGAVLGVDFERIWGRFWKLFGSPWVSKCRKWRSKNTKKIGRPNSPEKVVLDATARHESSMLAPLKRTNQSTDSKDKHQLTNTVEDS